MSHSRRFTRTAVLLALLVLPAVASAQPEYTFTPPPTLHEQYQMMRAELMISFWSQRLNEYRQQIDRMLSSTDRIKVELLRARVTLLLERMTRLQNEKRAREERVGWDVTYSEPASASSTDGSAASDTTTMAVDERYYAADTAGYGREMADREAEYQRKELELLQGVLDGNEAQLDSLARNSEFRSAPTEYDEDIALYEEMTEIRYVARWVTRNYRRGMDDLFARFSSDLVRYNELQRQATHEFLRKYRAKIMADPTMVSSMLVTLQDEMTPDRISRYWESDYTPLRSLLVAALLGYSGQDLREVMMIEELPLTNRIVEKLPGSSLVGRNVPNPASSLTEIPYRLTEPGSEVVIEVLDASGSVVATFAQEKRDVGSYDAQIDVTTLPAGSYFYRVRITTSKGERIQSRSMTIED